ncbi:MAG: cobyric acid synthase [Synergistaceae bacterium]|nr:cobyric acid synthase [Synergistaceae bacterium]
MRGIMIQGTSSDAGKSFLVTGLCRMLSDMGIKVCPFKSQNMSNNSCVTWDGREMSRAQAVQAEAARLRPETFMNPILLKPRRDTSSEIILDGKVFDAPAEKDYYRTFTRSHGIAAVRRALDYINKNFDVIVIEGAGSPAEINLNDSEIVNMRVAREADVPVLLVTDVDRGGSLASILGTLDILDITGDKERVKGVVFNKFRGDPDLFKPAVKWLEDNYKVKTAGVLPYVSGAAIAGEDSLSIKWDNKINAEIAIGVIRFPSVSNFTDLDALDFESDISLIGIDEDTPDKLFNNLDAVILPGSKNSMRDMAWLAKTGLAEKIKNLYNRGCFVLGLCGGYQMLGERLCDPDLRENSELKEINGLGLLPCETDFISQDKRTALVSGSFNFDNKIKVTGYEIHFGRTKILEQENNLGVKSLFEIDDRSEGAARKDLRAAGTYLHGVLDNDEFRAHWLNCIRLARGFSDKKFIDTRAIKDKAYNLLAEAMRENLDMKFIFNLMGI